MSETDSSICQWISQVKMGDEAAQREIWERFFPQLIRLSQKRLNHRVRRAGDEEDVALSVLNSFFQGAKENLFPEVRDRDDLWRLLSRMTQRKAIDWVRHQSRQKRRALGESALMGQQNAAESPEGASAHPLQNLASDQPTPLFELIVIEQCGRLMGLLSDDLRQIVQQKLAGHTNAVIAGQLECSVATIERRLKLVREIWSKAEEDERTQSDT